MITASFIDRYETTVTVRLQDFSDHVQLLLTWNGEVAISYGFARQDFDRFVKLVCELQSRIDGERGAVTSG